MQAVQNRERIKGCLLREERLQELWQETSKQLADQKKKLDLREEELIDVKKLHKKEKRKKFIQNTSVGIAIGIIGTLLLTNGT
jgi:hypothetical protein